ncbi:MAG: 16S rRNA (guanine(527)-N(7))-methyltransferase RsmG [Gammaproteobacteria bacterium]|nr:16S rRNA (guanine(527)-N(7))-methyltransferase RsmG [Gammaproteobacteria bacterium]
MDLSNLYQEIDSGCKLLKLELSSEIKNKLIDYLQLLIKWNKVYNLTAITDPKLIIHKHILDSLAIINFIDSKVKNIIDIGTGAGLPGIIIAIVKPDLKIVLLDSNNKKTAFLEQAKNTLKLKNIEIINQRVENYIPEELFDAIISRAFASLVDYVVCTEHLLTSSGRIYAMKGKLPDSETVEFKDKCSHNFVINKIFPVEVPFLVGESRCLLEIKKLIQIK